MKPVQDSDMSTRLVSYLGYWQVGPGPRCPLHYGRLQPTILHCETPRGLLLQKNNNRILSMVVKLQFKSRVHVLLLPLMLLLLLLHFC